MLYGYNLLKNKEYIQSLTSKVYIYQIFLVLCCRKQIATNKIAFYLCPFAPNRTRFKEARLVATQYYKNFQNIYFTS